ncbi:G-protein coupled receptor Mth [Halotydeus destructor]|nr:G-protein coupled receptor Mth [Halotydeus destructor]
MATVALTWPKGPTNQDTFECTPLLNAGLSVYAIAKCPQNRKISTKLRKLCEGSSVDIISDVVVFSKLTRMFYKNKYCAICNGARANLTKWTIRANCNWGPDVANMTSSNILKDATYNTSSHTWSIFVNDKDHTCRPTITEFTFPNMEVNFTAHFCHNQQVSKCASNATAQEQSECSAYTSFVFDTSQLAYRNYHCAKCNYVDMSTIACDSDMPILRQTYSSFAKPKKIQTWYPLLLDFNTDTGSDTVGDDRICSEEDGFFYNPLTDSCLQLHCDDGYLWDRDSQSCYLNSTNGDTNTLPLKLRSSCTKIRLTNTEYTLLNDSAIFVHSIKQRFGAEKYDKIEGNNFTGISLCSEDYFDSLPLNSVIIQSLLSQLLLSISIAGLTLHLLTCAVVKKLRNLPGKLLMSLCISLLCGQLSFLLSPMVQPFTTNCKLVAILSHYFFAASFCWSTVLAVDVYRTLTTMQVKESKWDQFISYSICAWSVPLVIILINLYLDVHCLSFAPNYGQALCWINQKKSLLWSFAIPLAITLLANVAFFTLTTVTLLKSNNVKRIQSSKRKIHFYLYLKLAVIMGLTWIFGFLAALWPSSEYKKYLWYPFIVFNGLQGAFIFFAFTFKRNNWSELRNFFSPGLRSSSKTDITRSSDVSSLANKRASEKNSVKN